MSRHEIFRREQKFYSVSHAVNFPLFVLCLFIFLFLACFSFILLYPIKECGVGGTERVIRMA
jgi:hypothetical protein